MVDLAYTPAGDNRLDGIGASESPILVLGRHYGKVPTDLYAEKLGLSESSFDNELMKMGRLLEPVVLRMAQEDEDLSKFGRPDVFQQRMRSREWPFLTCTPDAFLVVQGRVVPVQLKTTGSLLTWSDGAPQAVYVQCQHEMAVMAAPFAIAAVFGGGPGGLQFLWQRIERNEEFIEALVRTCGDFWTLLQEGGEPPIDGSEECRRALGKVYAAPEKGVEVPLPGEFVEVDAEIADAEMDLAAVEAHCNALKNRVRRAIGNAEVGYLPNGVRWSWKPDARGIRKLRRIGNG